MLLSAGLLLVAAHTRLPVLLAARGCVTKCHWKESCTSVVAARVTVMLKAFVAVSKCRKDDLAYDTPHCVYVYLNCKHVPGYARRPTHRRRRCLQRRCSRQRSPSTAPHLASGRQGRRMDRR